MDRFPHAVGSADFEALVARTSAAKIAASKGLTMGYYDGNTVTALWNYAQHYALNDRSFGTTFGPSTVGAINLISGHTNGTAAGQNADGALVGDGNGGFTLISDAQPNGDICSKTTQVEDYASWRFDERHEYRRSSDCRRDLMGMVRGRLQSQPDERKRNDRLPSLNSLRDNRRAVCRLPPHYGAIPVLCLHAEPATHTTGVNRGHWN
jgi:hypothetical protein